jgi:ribose 5-phosphate isomerase A
MRDELKRQAALAALEELRSGMVVGLGTGSTAAHFIRELGNRVADGMQVVAIPTSEASARLAEENHVPLTSLAQHPVVDVTVDGADEVSPQLDLIKGLGGALVREKIVAHASRRLIIVIDESKLVDRLGAHTVIPIEVIPFAAGVVRQRLLELGGECALREKNGQPFVSDNRNFVIDWRHGEISQPVALERQLKALTGVVDSGLFCGVAEMVLVAGADGVRKIQRSRLP